jgi:hypothetical protein
MKTGRYIAAAALTVGLIGLTAGPAAANTATLEADCDTAMAHLFNFGPKAHDLTFGGYVKRDGKFTSFGGPMPINADANGNETITLPLTALTTPGTVDVFLGAHWYDGQNVLHTQSGSALGLDCGTPATTTTTTAPPETTTTAPPATTTTTAAHVAPAAEPRVGGIGLAAARSSQPDDTGELPFTGHGPALTIGGVSVIGLGSILLALRGRRRKTV